MYENITSENVMIFAIKHYDNPQCESEKEFHVDMKRFKYIKRLLRKHKETGQCLKTLNAYRRIPKHWSRIVKIENAEAKRA